MARSGRKKKAGKRQPNGQLRRARVSVRERDARRTGIEARTRVHGVDPSVAHDQKAGYVLGRLDLAGHLGKGMHDAGLQWVEIVYDFSRANEIPMRTPRAVDLNAVKGQALSGGWSAKARQAIRERYEDAFAELLSAGRDALIAVNACCVYDEIVLLEPLRRGLEKLVRFLPVDARSMK